MTKEEWFALQVGDFVKMEGSLISRKILDFNNGCITLMALRSTKFNKLTTVYAKNDRYKFTKVDKEKCDA